MNVVVNGLMTSYQKVGKGNKTLVFLHGWGASSSSFKDLVQRLPGDYSILALDMPGFGGSQVPDKPWTLSDYSGFVADWLRKIGINKVDAFVGHSFGGSVAIVGISSKSLAPNKLIVLASAGIREKNNLKKKSLLVGAKIAKIPLMILPDAKAMELKGLLYKKAGSDMMLLPQMKETFKLTVSEDVRPAARQLKLPTLLIYGENDKETPISDGKVLAEAISDSHLEVIPNAGHFLFQEQPDQTVSLMLKFLESSA